MKKHNTLIECAQCSTYEVWTCKEDVSDNFEICGYCEYRYCLDCADTHICVEKEIK